MSGRVNEKQCNCLICHGSMKKIAKGEKWEYYKCMRCNWYMTKSKAGNDNSMIYEHYETFDNNVEDFDQFVIDAERILQHKFDLINRFPKSFLDVGTSEGVFVKAYNNLSNTNVGTGVEVSYSKITRARKRGLNIMHFCELKDRQFDFILLRHVIEHIENPVEYMKHIMGWLSPKGVLCIETPNNDSWLHKIKGRHINDITKEIYVRELYPPVHVCGFTPKSLKKIGGVCGLKTLHIETYDNRNLDFVYQKDIGSDRHIPSYARIFEKIKMGPNISAFFTID